GELGRFGRRRGVCRRAAWGVWTAPDGARRRVDGKPVGFPSLFVVRAAAPKTFRKAERRNLKSQT
ncbi:MAG: hypothetical protein IJO46_12725, partial [Thermoguttaceae bacterium]|nr:hypothetical protein [Thermoguttaceae bacterium]